MKMSDPVIPESQLAEQLIAFGFEIGKSRSGKILRVDNRQGIDQLDIQSVAPWLERVVRCSSLKELYLQDVTGALDSMVSEIALLPKLRVLDVEGSDLGDPSLQTLAKCPALQVLNVRGTEVTAKKVAELRKVMIGVRIIF